MKAILLAAGEGTRLRPITEVLPKCLVPIAGVPLLEYWLRACEGLGIQDVLVNTSFKAEVVEQYLSYYTGPLKIQISRESQLLGTAGTLFANFNFVGDQDLLLVHADNVSLFQPKEFLNAFENRGRLAATLMTFDTDAPETCGILELNQAGVVQKLHEKVANPPGTRANGAVYLLSAKFIQELRKGPTLSDFSNQVLTQLMGRANTFHNHFYHRDIGNPQSYLKSARELWRLKDFESQASEAWARLANETHWHQWVEAWRQLVSKVAMVRTIQELKRLPSDALDVDLILIETATQKELAMIRELSQTNQQISYLLWKAV